MRNQIVFLLKYAKHLQEKTLKTKQNQARMKEFQKTKISREGQYKSEAKQLKTIAEELEKHIV